MYMDDFIKEVKELSTKYDVEVTDGQVDVYYSRRKHAKYPKYRQVLTVPLQAQYTFSRRIGLDDFEALPFSHKLYMLGAELAMTPLDERTPESYKTARQNREINRAVQEDNHARREARVAEHKANKSKFVELQPLPKYTGINDVTGEPIFVGDIVERVIDMRNSYSSLENRDKEKFPDFDAMSKPFEVKRDCYLYGHWIAKSVAEGDNFGVKTICFSKDLLKVNGKSE